MNRTHVVAIIGAALLAVPLFALAEETGPTSSIYCPALSQTLSFGMRDSRTSPRGQVTELQKFLADYYDLNPDDYITGYFGRKTRDNVRKFQCEKNIVCSGNESNGYGVVGRKTRAAIADACGSHSTYTPLTDLFCVWNGQTVAHGWSITAYQASSVPSGSQCVSEQRTCNNGTLSGSYQYATCSVQAAQNQSCTWDNQTIQHGASITAYQATSVPSGSQCVSEQRTCNNGTFSGTYAYASCTVQQASAPTITSKNTDDAYPGDTITIFGTNFVSPNDILLDNVVQQTVGSTENNTKLSFLIPSSYPGSETNHTLTVRNANGTSNGSSLRVHGSQGGITDISVAAASRGSDRIDVFGRGTDGALWHRWWNGSSWSNWESLGGALTSGPAASWCPTCRLDVFARGTDNALWHKSYDNSTWSEWESLGGTLTSAPAAASRDLGNGTIRIDVFGRGTDNALWHKWWNGSSWSNWESLGGVITSAPAVSACPTCRLDVFARGTDNALWHKSYDNSTWSEWESLGGILTSGPAAATRAIGDNTIRIDTFVRGADNALYHKWWNGSSWSNWESLGGILTSSPAVSYCPTCRLDVFHRGADNALWQSSFDGSTWSPWASLGGVLTSTDKNSNLASALTALQSALQSLLQLLK